MSARPPPVDRMTDTCENITFPHADGKKSAKVFSIPFLIV